MIRASEVMQKIKKMENQYLINGNEELTKAVQNKIASIDWQSKFNENRFYRENIDIVEQDTWCKTFLHNMEENRCVSSKIAAHTRYAKLKKIVLKIMKVALRWQEEFNTGAFRFAQASADKISMLTSKSVQLQEQNNILRQQLEKLMTNIDAITERVNEINEKVINNESCLQGIGETVKNNEDWLRLESGKVDSNETLYSNLRKELFFELEKNKRNDSYINKCLEKESATQKKKTNEKIKINLGCGSLDMEGYINVDMRDLPNVDIVADVLHLPFRMGEVDEIYTSHLIEHFTSMQMLKEILPYWYGLLKKGGVLVAILPNIGYMAKEYAKGNIPFEQLAEVISGGQEYEGNYHLAVYDEKKIEGMMKEIGFREINIETANRKNGLCWEMEIHGVK